MSRASPGGGHPGRLTLRERVFAVIQEHPGATMPEIARQVGTRPQRSCNILRQLYLEGHLSRSGDGGRQNPFRYFATAKQAPTRRTPGRTPRPRPPKKRRVTAAAVRAYVAGRGAKGVHAADVQEALQLTRTQTHNHLRRMVDRGQLERAGYGGPLDPYRYTVARSQEP